jgi:hypothetical protein
MGLNAVEIPEITVQAFQFPPQSPQSSAHPGTPARSPRLVCYRSYLAEGMGGWTHGYALTTNGLPAQRSRIVKSPINTSILRLFMTQPDCQH